MISKLQKFLVSTSVAMAVCVSLSNVAFAQRVVVAKVGDLEITEQELSFAEADMAKQFESVAPDNRRGAILSALIDIKLLANKAEKEGLQDNEILKAQLEFQRSRALHNLYFQKNVAPNVSDDEIKSRYDTEIAGLTPAKQVKARHILVKTEEEAKAVIAELDAGKSFEELAKARSTGPTGPNGGDLGYFSKGQMVPEFDAAVFEMKQGEYSKVPVKTQFGYHVILREDERDEPAPEFEKVKEQIRQVILRDKYFQTVEESRKEFKIEVLDEKLKAQIEAAQKQ